MKTSRAGYEEETETPAPVCDALLAPPRPGSSTCNSLGMAATCEHLDQIHAAVPEHVEGCEDCMRIGSQWVHLRVCRSCGHVGCCDSSPNRHASAHAASTGHPIMSSLEPGEDWSWCVVDEVAFVVPPDAQVQA
jgi:hypothetical protein